MPVKFATLLSSTMSLLAALMFAGLMFAGPFAGLMFAGLMFVVLMSTGPAIAETALKFSLDFIMFGPNSPFVYADEHGYFKKRACRCGSIRHRDQETPSTGWRAEPMT